MDKSLPGCGCKIINTEGYVWFEIGNFKRAWAVKERMRVIAVSANETNEFYFQLNSCGCQNLAALTLEPGDNIGPICSNALANDLPSIIIAEGTASIDLTATIDDSISGNTNIKAAEYYINSEPGMNAGISIPPGDEAFDEPKEEVKVIVNTSSWEKGTYVIYLRGKDAAENWGSADLVYVSVQSEKEGGDGGGGGGCFIDNF